MEKLTEVLGSEAGPSLEMGGYATYVWPSFIIAFVVLLAMVILSVRSLRKAQKTLFDLQQSATPSISNET